MTRRMQRLNIISQVEVNELQNKRMKNIGVVTGPMTKYKVSHLVKTMHRLLSSQDYQDIIAWVDQHTFVIRDRHRFLPIISEQLHYADFQSFLRQLYKRSFKKVAGSALHFYHQHFGRSVKAQQLTYISFNSARNYLCLDPTHMLDDREQNRLKNRLRSRRNCIFINNFPLKRVSVVQNRGEAVWQANKDTCKQGANFFQFQLKWQKPNVALAYKIESDILLQQNKGCNTTQ